MDFRDKVIWITGASSGIGKALVMLFATMNVKLVLSSRNKEELDKLAKLCAGHSECMVLPLDLGNMQDAPALAQRVIDRFGRIDILINNGGVSQRSLANETPLEIDRKIMEVNYFGQVALTKSVLPWMLKQKSGHIVVVSSIAGKFGFWFRSAYSASKHALHGFFEALRLENEEHGIKVLMAVPGKIQSNISVNALKGDGSTHNVMDKSQEEGMPAEECAALIIAAIRTNEEEILIGNREIKAVWLKRHFPKWFGRVIRKQKRE